MDAYFWQLPLLFAVGTVAGILNVLAGGGSLLSVPMMLFLGVPGPVANGTNRISIIAQTAAPELPSRRIDFSTRNCSA